MSPHRFLWFFIPCFHLGGDEGIRTPDPLLAGQVLSQLSYTPSVFFFTGVFYSTIPEN